MQSRGGGGRCATDMSKTVSMLEASIRWESSSWFEKISASRQVFDPTPISECVSIDAM